MDVQLSLWNPALNSLGYMPRSGISGLYGNSIFNFFKEIPYCFPYGCTILHSHQRCTRVPVSPHPRQHLLFSGLLIVPILMRVRWYLIVVLICIYLMISDVEHPFIRLLVIFISSLENGLFKSFAHFKIGLLGLPWWRSGWESACQCRGHGFEPWSGKIPHAAEQLGPWATTTEPARWSLCSATGEAAIVRAPCTTMKSDPLLPQLEKARAQKRRPNTTKN